MEAESSGARRHGLSSTGTFLTQVPVQCQELQKMTEGNSRNVVPGKGLAAHGQGKFMLTQHNPDQVLHKTCHGPNDARDAALRRSPSQRLLPSPSHDITLP